MNSVDRYKAMSRPPLGHKKSCEMLARAQAGDQRARDEVVLSNIMFVVGEAKKYLGLGLEMDDLVPEGILGLGKAVDRWDESRGVKFLTYARWWVKQALIQAVADTGRAVRLPVNRAQLASDIARYLREEEAAGRKPRREEIAERFGVKQDRLDDVMRADRHLTSLDKPRGEHENFALVDALPWHGAAPDEDVAQDSESGMLEDLIGALPDRRARIIVRMWGEDASLGEIGAVVGLSRERVRQIKEGAMARLRHEAARRERDCARRMRARRAA